MVNDLLAVAKRIYQLVEINGIEECVEPSLLRSAFLAALVLGDRQKIDLAKRRMKAVEMPRTEIGNMANTPCIEAILATNGSLGWRLLENLTESPEFIEIKTSQERNEYASTSATSGTTNAEQEFLRKSYDYRQALSTYYNGIKHGGNIRFGGGLPQQLITKGDINIFTDMLSKPIAQLVPTQDEINSVLEKARREKNTVAERFFTSALTKLYQIPNGLAVNGDTTLNSIKNINDALNAMQLIVSLNFQALSDSYDPDKAGFRELDYAMSALNKSTTDLTAARKAHYDSSTSLSIMYGMRTGDCRHHGESMQLLFDTWKHKKLIDLLPKEQIDSPSEEQTNNNILFNDLCNTQLRTIDTLEENEDSKSATGKSFNYDHTFNVLVKPDTRGQISYTVYDAFDLDQGPLQITPQLEKNELLFSTRKISQPSKNVRYKLATYAGDKGTPSPDNNLSLLGASGITSKSVLDSIILPKEKQQIHSVFTELAQQGETRRRNQMSLDELYSMFVEKGYTFHNPPKTQQLNPEQQADAKALIDLYIRDKQPTPSSPTHDDARLQPFVAEVMSRPDLLEKLSRKSPTATVTAAP